MKSTKNKFKKIMDKLELEIDETKYTEALRFSSACFSLAGGAATFAATDCFPVIFERVVLLPLSACAVVALAFKTITNLNRQLKLL